MGHQSPITTHQSLSTALREGSAQLEREKTPSAALAAEMLLMHTLGRDRAWLYAHPEMELDAATRKAEQGSTRQRDEVQKLQAQVGDLRQQLGVLEGNLDALRTENARYVDEAVQARDQRDQLALSLTQAAAKQKGSTAKSTAAPRKSSGSVGKSPRTKKL